MPAVTFIQDASPSSGDDGENASSLRTGTARAPQHTPGVRQPLLAPTREHLTSTYSRSYSIARTAFENNTNNNDGDDVSERGSESSSSSVRYIPYVSLPHHVRRHMITRAVLVALAVAAVVCSALTMQVPLCKFVSETNTHTCTMKQLPSIWLRDIELAPTSVSSTTDIADSSTTDNVATLSSVRVVLSAIQTGAVGALIAAVLDVLACVLFLSYRWYMESERVEDNREAAHTVHRLSEIFFTRREVRRRRFDVALGWVLAVLTIAALVFNAVDLIGALVIKMNVFIVMNVAGRLFILTSASGVICAGVGFVLDALLLVLLFSPPLSDFQVCGATVVPVCFAGIAALNTQETEQSRALRENVRRQREDALRRREEATRRANTVRGLTLEQSMPPSPWSFSLYSYAQHTHGPVVVDCPEGSVFLCSSHVASRGGGSARPQRLAALEEFSFVSESAAGKTNVEMSAIESDEGQRTHSPDEAWLVTVDEDHQSNANSPSVASARWSAVRNPLLGASLRQYMKDSVGEAGLANQASQREELSLVDAPSERAHGAGRGLSVDGLFPNAGVSSLRSFSVGWRSDATGLHAPSRQSSISATTRSERAGSSVSENDASAAGVDGPTFTEFLCFAQPPASGESDGGGVRRLSLQAKPLVSAAADVNGERREGRARPGTASATETTAAFRSALLSARRHSASPAVLLGQGELGAGCARSHAAEEPENAREKQPRGAARVAILASTDATISATPTSAQPIMTSALTNPGARSGTKEVHTPLPSMSVRATNQNHTAGARMTTHVPIRDSDAAADQKQDYLDGVHGADTDH